MPTHRTPRARFLALALLPLLALAAHAQAPPTQPLFANLTLPLDISRLKVGSKLQARLVTPWASAGCNLRLGALLEGHVSQVEHRSKTSPRSAMHLVFDTAECDRHRGTPFHATLIALLGPADAPSGMGKARSLTDQPALTTSANTAAPSVAPTTSSGFRSVEASAAMNAYEPVGRSLPTQWTIGMVVDCPMTLAVGTGAEGGSIISSSTADARLEAQTTLILVATPLPAPTP